MLDVSSERLTVTLEQRFFRTADGTVWSSAPFHAAFWDRYLSVFEEVIVVARVLDVEVAPVGCLPSGNDRTTFADLPYYIGPLGYLRNRSAILNRLRNALRAPTRLLLRIPSQLAIDAAKVAREHGLKYAVEVVGDPWDVFAPGAMRHPMRPVLRHYFAHRQKQLCATASGAAFVTQRRLQTKYPPAPGAITAIYSSVDIDPKHLDVEHAVGIPVQRIITVASLEQPYKGVDVLLRSIAGCRQQGLQSQLTIVGSGRCECLIRDLAERLGIAANVQLTGQVSPQRVFELLQGADLFVLPSYTEGLPRALLEAMACGLPCIATSVGGIPEVLDERDLVVPGSHESLTKRILEVAWDKNRLVGMSVRNRASAEAFTAPVLSDRREAFYRGVASA